MILQQKVMLDEWIRTSTSALGQTKELIGEFDILEYINLKDLDRLQREVSVPNIQHHLSRQILRILKPRSRIIPIPTSTFSRHKRLEISNLIRRPRS